MQCGLSAGAATSGLGRRSRHLFLAMAVPPSPLSIDHPSIPTGRSASALEGIRIRRKDEPDRFTG